MQTVLNILANPVAGLLNGIVTPGNPTNGGCAVIGVNSTFCSAAIGFLTIAVQQLLDLDGSGTATAVFNGMHDAANLVQQPRFGGGIEIKTYDPNTHVWTGEYVLDTFNLVWRAQPACVKSGSNQNPQTCCGHYVFDGGTLGMQVFKAQVTGTATLRPAASNTTNDLVYDITMDEMQLAIAYGALVKALLENVILPKALPATFPGNNDGIVTLGELVHRPHLQQGLQLAVRHRRGHLLGLARRSLGHHDGAHQLAHLQRHAGLERQAIDRRRGWHDDQHAQRHRHGPADGHAPSVDLDESHGERCASAERPRQRHPRHVRGREVQGRPRVPIWACLPLRFEQRG